MKLIKIGDKEIVVSHITHFEFTPLLRFEHTPPENPNPLPGYTVVSTDKPAQLLIWIDGNEELRFIDADAEEGHKKLKEIFS